MTSSQFNGQTIVVVVAAAKFFRSFVFKRFTTGKTEKVHSSHVTAMKFVGKKQLV